MNRFEVVGSWSVCDDAKTNVQVYDRYGMKDWYFGVVEDWDGLVKQITCLPFNTQEMTQLFSLVWNLKKS